MNAPSMTDMIEATRLTREGRLNEAMAVLRRALTRTPASPAAANTRPSGRTPPLIEMVPPSTETGSAWTAPQASKTNAAPTPDRERPEIRDVLRGFLDRLPHGVGRTLDGLGGRGVSRVKVPDGARFEERNYANAAGSRRYKLYVPSGYDGQARPLVVMLHGCNQSPDDFAAGTRMNDLAEEKTFLVAYPAQAQSANASRCWNWFNPADQERDKGEPSLIAGITREIMRDLAVARGRVYIAGLSAGGAAAAIMGSAYPDLYAAIGIHSGLACGAADDIASAFAAMRQGRFSAPTGSRQHDRSAGTVPTIVFHGDRDTIVSPLNADRIIAQSKAAVGLRTAVSHGKAPGGIQYTRIVQSDEHGRSMLEQWILHEAGHAWSGGRPAGSYTEPRGPDASREMIRFFFERPPHAPHSDHL